MKKINRDSSTTLLLKKYGQGTGQKGTVRNNGPQSRKEQQNKKGRGILREAWRTDGRTEQVRRTNR